MKKAFVDIKYTGILWSILFNAIFVILSLIGLQFLEGISWFLYSSILRIVFGVIILFAIKRIYGKSVKEIINLHNWKSALIAGIGFLIYFIYYIILFLTGIKNIVGLSIGLLISQVFLQQFATGFYEELSYRFLILEGFFYQTNKSVIVKLLYAAISFVLFGVVHVVTGWSLYTFIFTGIIGFAFATVYLISRNILIPMLLHFVYDVLANLSSYIEWNNSSVFNALNFIFEVMLGVMLIISFILLIKKDNVENK